MGRVTVARKSPAANLPPGQSADTASFENNFGRVSFILTPCGAFCCAGNETLQLTC
jgi:hypothetical protein